MFYIKMISYLIFSINININIKIVGKIKYKFINLNYDLGETRTMQVGTET